MAQLLQCRPQSNQVLNTLVPIRSWRQDLRAKHALTNCTNVVAHLRLGPARHLYLEMRVLATTELHLDASLVSVDNLLNNIESESQSLVLSRLSFTALKRLEQMRNHVLRYAPNVND